MHIQVFGITFKSYPICVRPGAVANLDDTFGQKCRDAKLLRAIRARCERNRNSRAHGVGASVEDIAFALFVCLCACFFVCSHFLMLGCLFACASLSASLSPCLSACLSVCLSVCLAVCLSLFVCLSVLGKKRRESSPRFKGN